MCLYYTLFLHTLRIYMANHEWKLLQAQNHQVINAWWFIIIQRYKTSKAGIDHIYTIENIVGTWHKRRCHNKCKKHIAERSIRNYRKNFWLDVVLSGAWIVWKHAWLHSHMLDNYLIINSFNRPTENFSKVPKPQAMTENKIVSLIQETKSPTCLSSQRKE